LPLSITEFKSLGGTKIWPALQNLLTFVFITKKLCTCVNPEVTHSLKLRQTLGSYMCSDATKSIVYVRTLASITIGSYDQGRQGARDADSSIVQ